MTLSRPRTDMADRLGKSLRRQFGYEQGKTWEAGKPLSETDGKHLGDGIYYKENFPGEWWFLHDCGKPTGWSSWSAKTYRWGVIDKGEKKCKRCKKEYPAHIQLMVKLDG